MLLSQALLHEISNSYSICGTIKDTLQHFTKHSRFSEEHYLNCFYKILLYFFKFSFNAKLSL